MRVITLVLLAPALALVPALMMGHELTLGDLPNIPATYGPPDEPVFHQHEKLIREPKCEWRALFYGDTVSSVDGWSWEAPVEIEAGLCDDGLVRWRKRP